MRDAQDDRLPAASGGISKETAYEAVKMRIDTDAYATAFLA
jgi:hypothetical protein